MIKFEPLIGKVVGYVAFGGAKRATKYVSEDCVVRATRIGKRQDSVDSDIRVKIGSPNYLEREFIRKAVEAGEKFPIKKVQLKW